MRKAFRYRAVGFTVRGRIEKQNYKEKSMKEIILIKDGELALKGLNRSSFEDILIKNMKEKLLIL